MTADFAAAIAQVTMEGRALAESNMQDTCIITRAGQGKGEWNESTGQYDPPADVTIYTGKCRVQVKSVIAASSDTNAGDRAGTIQELELQLPVAGTDTVAINDVAKVLTAPLDDSLVDREFTVIARHEKSQATARRLRIRTGTS